jgi:hypothetical protein
MEIIGALLLLWFLPNLIVLAAQGLFTVMALVCEITPIRWVATIILGIIITPFYLLWIALKLASFHLLRLFLRTLILARWLIS